FIYTAISLNIPPSNENKNKGFGYAILETIYSKVIYDEKFMQAVVHYQDYPLDKFKMIASMGNAIDLSRMLILLKLDISALLGYTGAVFNQFFGTPLGSLLSLGMLFVWVVFPALRIVYKAGKKDF